MSLSTENQVESVETVITNHYRARQKDSFERVGGGPHGWIPTPILDILPNGEIVFDLPPDYKTVRPWTEKAFEENGTAIGNERACQLCGWSPLVHFWPIQQDDKKLLMYVGSECVNNFMGAGYVTKQVKKFKETKLRQAFKDWIPEALKECALHTEYVGGTRLTYAFWKFRNPLLVEGISQKFGAIKIRNTFKKARKLGIPIPSGILEDDDSVPVAPVAYANGRPIQFPKSTKTLERTSYTSPVEIDELLSQNDVVFVDWISNTVFVEQVA